MSGELFNLENVSYSYTQGADVLRGIDLRIDCGERISIIGVNGCGKSTLLKLLAGLIFPVSGKFAAFGKDICEKSFGSDEAAAYHRRVGFVFQDSDVQLFCSTVREELAFGPLQLGLNQAETDARIADTAEMLGITGLLDKAPIHLSGGEKKKAAIASTLILDPDVIILDEPTNNLDPRSQSWLLKLLRVLSGAGKTLIFATHELELIPHVSDRAILFGEDHRIAADLPVKEMLGDTALLRRVNLVDEHFHTHPWDFENN